MKSLNYHQKLVRDSCVSFAPFAHNLTLQQSVKQTLPVVFTVKEILIPSRW